MEAVLKLRRFVEPPAPKYEKCEMCGAPMEAAHRHVVDLSNRRLICACRPCYLLFTNRGAAGGRLRSVPQRYVKLPKIDLAEIPVGVVFFIRDSATDRVKAFYPSPAGATESTVSNESWAEMTGTAPQLAALESDVEALLISKNDSWIVPVDACYELVGRIKKTWRGFDGGSDAWREINGFFASLQEAE